MTTQIMYLYRNLLYLPGECAATRPECVGKLFPTESDSARFPETSLSREAEQLSLDDAQQLSRDVTQLSRDVMQLSRDVMFGDVSLSRERWEEEELEKVEKIRLQLEDVSASVMLSSRVLQDERVKC